MDRTALQDPARGVYAALATPRRKNLAEPDTAAFLDYLDIVVRAGVNGLVLFGATGEFIHFDIADRMSCLNLAIKRSRVPVLVNVSHSTLDGTIALAQDAIDRGAAGLLVLPPYFFRYTDDQVEAFYLSLAEAVEQRSRIYLYSLPLYTHEFSPALLEKLIRSGMFAGIKDSSGSWQSYQLLQELRRSNSFQLLVGNEAVYFRGRLEGADGIISGVAAALPELVIALDKAILDRNMVRAERLNARLEVFLQRILRFPATVGIKQAAVVRGWRLDYPAVPPAPSDREELESFRAWLRDWIPETLQECGHA